jgi:hypothetical protein
MILFVRMYSDILIYYVVFRYLQQTFEHVSNLSASVTYLFI